MTLDWLTIIIISVFAYSGVDLLEKILITTRIKNSLFMAIFLALFYPLHLIIISIIWNLNINMYSMISFGIGVGMSFAYLLFMHSLLLEELSRITILGYIHPVLVALFAYIFLNERLELLDYLAILMLISSASIVSYKKNTISKALLPMLGLNVALTIEYVLIKYVLTHTDYWNYVFWFMAGLILARISFFIDKKVRDGFTTLKFDKHMLLYGFGISMLFLIATLTSAFAISLQSVSIISALYATQPMVILLLLYIVNKVKGNIIEEDLSFKTVISKGVAALLIILAIYILAT